MRYKYFREVKVREDRTRIASESDYGALWSQVSTIARPLSSVILLNNHVISLVSSALPIAAAPKIRGRNDA